MGRLRSSLRTPRQQIRATGVSLACVLSLLLAGFAPGVASAARSSCHPAAFTGRLRPKLPRLCIDARSRTDPSRGARGPRGTTGRRGSVGATGASGRTGSAGPQGERGAIGFAGLPGPAGLQGLSGTVGTPGAEGPAGTAGVEGKEGSPGAVGAPGAAGQEGAQGPRGEQGIPGAEGEEGTPGTPGGEGPEGAQGPRGEQGTPGAEGKEGADGPEGPVGAALSEFAEFYAEMPGDNPADVTPGAPVEFPRSGPSSGGIAAPSATEFVLPDPGIYRVSFTVPVTQPGQLDMALDAGAGMEELPYTVYGRSAGASSIAGEALVSTTVPNELLELRNPAGSIAALTITPDAGGALPAVASLIIQRLS
jgi:Collagen triple helix repeat (20 copies)